MHDMARLRLLSEVDQLARQCQNASPCSQQPKEMEVADKLDVPISGGETPSVTDSFVSPYVVLDAYCLTSHLSAVKQLVHSGAFVLIIPAAGRRLLPGALCFAVVFILKTFYLWVLGLVVKANVMDKPRQIP